MGQKEDTPFYLDLTDNLLEAIQEEIFLMHDSIIEKTEVTLGEKDKYIWVSSA